MYAVAGDIPGQRAIIGLSMQYEVPDRRLDLLKGPSTVASRGTVQIEPQDQPNQNSDYHPCHEVTPQSRAGLYMPLACSPT